MECVPLVLCAAEANRERMGSAAGLLSAIGGGMSAHVANADVQSEGLWALGELAQPCTTQCGAHSVHVRRMSACVEQSVWLPRVPLCTDP